MAKLATALRAGRPAGLAFRRLNDFRDLAAGRLFVVALLAATDVAFAGTALELVLALAADQLVFGRAAVEDVSATFTEQRVLAGLAEQGILARSAASDVV